MELRPSTSPPPFDILSDMPWLFGKERAQTVRTHLQKQINQESLTPALAVLLIGSDPASALYVDLKKKAAEEIGVRLVLCKESNLTTEEAVAIIDVWNADPSIHGILVQLPLPDGLETERIMSAIAPTKDVDSFHPENRAALLDGNGRIFSPVHLAVLNLIAMTPLSLIGAKTLILAKSPIFSEPLQHLLKRAGALVDVSTHVVPAVVLKEYKLIITALGQANILSGAMLDEEAIVIDISTTKLPDGSVVGDFDKETILETQSVSAVPGGVGPLTIAFLLQNVVEMAKKQIN